MTTAASAADLFATSYEPAPAVIDEPVELGTGWYLRGDAVFAREQTPSIASTLGASRTRNGYEGDLGFGYKFNNWFRADVTGGWGSVARSASTSADTWCPYADALKGVDVTGANNVSHHFLSYDPTDTCAPRQRMGFSQRNLMLNGYVDLGTWSGVTPYVGAGVGVANLRGQQNLDFYKTSDGSLFNGVDVTSATVVSADCQYAPGRYTSWFNVGTGQCQYTNVAQGVQNWSRSASGAKYNFAWSLMAGFAFDISDHAKLDVGYRYMNLGSFSTLGATYDYSNGMPVLVSVAKSSKTLSSQQVKVGVRYMID